MKHNVILILLLFALLAFTTGEQVLFREDFRDLANWKEVFFPKIPRHTTYSAEQSENKSYLVAKSSASASLLVYKKSFDVYEHPYVRWRWRIGNIYQKADPMRKDGDDYPVRIYIAFEYDPQKAGSLDRIEFNAAKLIYGEYPPMASLNYVWSSKIVQQKFLPSPYTARDQVIPLEMGESKIDKWVDEEVNIVQDYEKVFGHKPPRRATIGIMNDSDNTGEKSTSYLEFIEVYKK
jgi:hypothetical protein